MSASKKAVVTGFVSLSIIAILALPASSGSFSLGGNGKHKACQPDPEGAAFKDPVALAINPLGQIFVTDNEVEKIKKIDPAQGIVTTFAGGFTGSGTCNGVVSTQCADGQGTQAKFAYPTDLLMDNNGNIYVADGTRIRKIDPQANVTTFAGIGASGDSGGDLLTEASFKAVSGLAFNPNQSEIYVSDLLNHRIRKIKIAENEVISLAGSGLPGYSNGSLGPLIQFNNPQDIAYDPVRERLYIADSYNHRIRILEEDIISGPFEPVLLVTVSTFAGTGVNGTQDGPVATAQFSYPTYLYLDPQSQYLYIASSGNKIRRIDLDTNIVSTYAGSGEFSYFDGDLLSASFKFPEGLTINNQGEIFVADNGNNAVRKIADNVVSTVAGTTLDNDQDGPISIGKQVCALVNGQELSTCHTDAECPLSNEIATPTASAGGSVTPSCPQCVPGPIYAFAPGIDVFDFSTGTFLTNVGRLYSYNSDNVFNWGVDISPVMLNSTDKWLMTKIKSSNGDHSIVLLNSDLTALKTVTSTGVMWQGIFDVEFANVTSIAATKKIDPLYGFSQNIIIGMPSVTTPQGLGKIQLRNGSTFSLMNEFFGAPGEALGYQVLGTQDINGDQIEDIVATAIVVTSPKVKAISGNDGSTIWEQMYSGSLFSDFGVSLAKIKDINGDNKDDIVVGAPKADPGGLTNAGSVFVYSGKTGALLYTIDGTSSNLQLGISLSDVPSLDGDNIADLIIGAAYTNNQGKVFVYSGQNGSLLWEKTGAANQDKFGSAVLGIKDINGDNKGEVIVGAPGNFFSKGRIYVYSGTDGALLWEKSGENLSDFYGQLLVGDTL
jgi:sugar lactone lactonase YvrE